MSRSPSRQHRVKFLHGKQIEREAQLLLDEWEEAGHALGVPVPVGDLVELHLGLPFFVEDLRALFGGQDVFGAIWFGDGEVPGTIRVDASLDPAVYPEKLGRYNFTVAHELGHWRLHREQLRGDPGARVLFEAGGRPAFVCRDGDRAPEERQADQFAACLLMPRELLCAQWAAWRGGEGPVPDAELGVRPLTGDPARDVEIARSVFCKPLAQRFEVSAQAMRIRLEGLGLLVREVEPKLF